MSWFVLNPPPGTRIVSFFVTARLAGQSDRIAFIDNVLEQLLTILDEDLPPLLTDSNREAHLLGLLEDAAHACLDRGEQFVLLVDGLDEDRGMPVGGDVHSICALLPELPPAGMKVIVAGRPDPPIPGDVRPHHPLRDPGIVRMLAPSPQAEAVRADMERELNRLLNGTQAEQDLLGLLAAAGGGLTAADLAELTGSSVWAVERSLGTVAGRNFTRRNSHYRASDVPEVYLLGHEELQVTANTMLGTVRLEHYRQRLHDWADRYRDHGWPVSTPEYLLRGYHTMLTAAGDLSRVTALATDLRRHDRMLDLSGGDAAALTEITTTLTALANQPAPDLIAIARLAIHRDHLIDRNTNIPVRLPALWATLGDVTRAEALARSITDPERQSSALTKVAETAALAGDLDRAEQLINTAEALAHNVTDSERRSWALVSLANAALHMKDQRRAGDLLGAAEVQARSLLDRERQSSLLAKIAATAALAGDLDRAEQLINTAETLAHSIGSPARRSTALAKVAETVALTGDGGRASELITAAEALACTISDIGQRSWSLAKLAETSALTGDRDRASRLLEAAQRHVYEIWRGERDKVLTAIAIALACAAQLDRAETLARSFTSAERQNSVLAKVAEVAAQLGDLDRAQAIAHTITSPREQIAALANAAEAAVQANETDRASDLIRTAESLARSSADPSRQSASLVSVSRETTRLSDVDEAESRARAVAKHDQQSVTAMKMAVAAAQAGDLNRAHALVHTILDPHHRSSALVLVAEVAANAGRLSDTVALARSASIGDQRSSTLAKLADIAAHAGNLDYAHAIARSITHVDRQILALASVARTAMQAENPRMARESFDVAENLANCLDSQSSRLWAKVKIAEAAAHAGDLVRAEALARSIDDSDRQSATLVVVAEIAASIGELDQAQALAQSIAHDGRKSAALVTVAKAAARAADWGRAGRLVEMIVDPYHRDSASVALTNAAAAAGAAEQVKVLARLVADPDRRNAALAAAAEKIAKAGDPASAEILSAEITDRRLLSRTLVDLAMRSESAQAERFVAWALVQSHWTTSLRVLAKAFPHVLETMTAELAIITSHSKQFTIVHNA